MPLVLSFKPSAADFKVFEKVMEKIAKPTPNSLNGIERAVRQGFLANFSRQNAGGGGAWAALARRTQRERRQQGYPATFPILVRSGRLMRSWTELGGFKQMAYRPDGWDMIVGSSDYRAAAHELGVRGRNLPARPVGALAESEMRGIALAVEKWIDQVIRTTV